MIPLPAYQPERLKELILQLAVTHGDFTLASGAKATFYLDCRKLTLHPDGLVQVAAGMVALLQQQPLPDAVGGMAIGADPITAGLIHHAGLAELPLRGFIVRKEAKGHGTGRQVEGPVSVGQKVVIVEDVVTSGGSSLKAIQAVRDYGLEVTRVLAIVDRQAGGKEAFGDAGVAFDSLFTLTDLGLTTA